MRVVVFCGRFALSFPRSFGALSLSLSQTKRAFFSSSKVAIGCTKEISKCECGAERGKGRNAEDHGREDDDDDEEENRLEMLTSLRLSLSLPFVFIVR